MLSSSLVGNTAVTTNGNENVIYIFPYGNSILNGTG